ncbi:Exonuclease V [Corchorus capsularis]|uniref:Exonuclease V n=1 Tax=Corchorus capsularis TaxID=210143 RepID=A0A1R3HLL6_COCAP|nr:Exonuclease V [Corchorus capsularis]
MSESESPPAQSTPPNPEEELTQPNIPIEFVSEEEMALIEAAYAATRSSISSSICSPSRFQSNTRSIQSITLFSKRSFSDSTQPDIEDSGNFLSTQKKTRSGVAEPFLHRFRRERGLSVTDITATEWCEKQMEFSLLFGKRKISKAMKVGQARHVKLEQEVVKKVKVGVESAEDIWAIKFNNFICGANQLLFEGLTRELPLIGFVEGVWLVGVIDEIRMPQSQSDKNPILVDTKTRQRDFLPAEPQRRNGRLQLMCYKHLWDTLVTGAFPTREFFDVFSLNRNSILSEDIREKTANSGFPAKREASYTPEEERWKCRHCQFATVCPGNPKPDTTSGSRNSDPSSPLS